MKKKNNLLKTHKILTIHEFTMEFFTKEINNLRDFDNNLISIKLILTKTNNNKKNLSNEPMNCKAEIFDSIGRYFYCEYLCQSYEYNCKLIEDNNLNIIFTYEDYCVNLDRNFYDDAIKINNKFNIIYLFGGSQFYDQYPLYEHKVKHINILNTEIKKLELKLLNLKNNANEILKNYSNLNYETISGLNIDF